jgi:diguanylate cyclase (GGDEF)-like protein/PAS domain S-box-containing protein
MPMAAHPAAGDRGTHSMQTPLTSEPSARILVVDDEPRLLASLRHLLRIAGHDVVIANGGEAAIGLLASEQFDLLLLDLWMPGVDGHAVMRFVATQRHQPAIVVVSGNSDIDAAIDALRGGAADFIRKPYEADELLRTVDNTLARRRLERENRAMTARLEQSELWHRFLVDNSPDLIYILDANGCFAFLSHSVSTLLGYSRDELVGRPLASLVHPEDHDRVTLMLQQRDPAASVRRDLELRLMPRQTGRGALHFETRYTDIDLTPGGLTQAGPDGPQAPFRGIYGVAKDITERKKAEEMIYHQAYHDLLTGLPNRLLFKDHLALAIAQAKRGGELLAVMFLDLDRFKSVNDSLGHVIGDQLLQHVAARLSSCVREGDTLARFGGDEFTLLLPRVSDREAVANTARKILALLQKPFFLAGQEICTGASVGIAVYPEDGDHMDALIKSADIAMYEVKATGRDNYAFFSASRDGLYSRRLSFENELRAALVEGQLVLHYQPLVDAAAGRIRGVEALVRWNHPTRGTLQPGDFIAFAEETGLIGALGQWVLRTACADAAGWQRGGRRLGVSVNLSAQQIDQEDFVPMVTGILAEAGLDPTLLTLEITETVLVRDVERNVARLHALNRLGVRLAIDDFGTGYSSIGYLRSLPIDAIKIDRSFVQDVAHHPENASIVRALILIARGLHLNLIAEGVETSEQLDFLRANDCTECQGFLFGAAVPADDITRLLADGP